MFQSLVETRNLDFHQLPRLREKYLHPTLREVLKDADRNVVLVCLKMVGYVGIVKHKEFSEVTPSDILTKEVEQAVYVLNQQISWNMVPPARTLCRLLQNQDLFPRIYRRRDEYHPLLLAWANSLPASRFNDARTMCTYFLQWLTKIELHEYTSGTVPVLLLSRDVVLRFRHFLMARVSRAEISRVTARGYLATTIRWICWLHDQGKIGSLDLSRITIRAVGNKERILPTYSQIQKFLHVLSTNEKWSQYLVYFLFMLTTGARPIELQQLTLEHVAWNRQQIWLQSKNGLGRWMPIPDEVWRQFENYLGLRRSSMSARDLVFVTENGNPYCNRSINRFFASIQREAGVHIDGQMAFRHRFATDCLEQGVSLNVTRYMMDHRDTSQLIRYQHVNHRNLVKNVDNAFKSIPWVSDLDV